MAPPLRRAGRLDLLESAKPKLGSELLLEDLGSEKARDGAAPMVTSVDNRNGDGSSPTYPLFEVSTGILLQARGSEKAVVPIISRAGMYGRLDVEVGIISDPALGSMVPDQDCNGSGLSVGSVEAAMQATVRAAQVFDRLPQSGLEGQFPDSRQSTVLAGQVLVDMLQPGIPEGRPSQLGSEVPLVPELCQGIEAPSFSLFDGICGKSDVGVCEYAKDGGALVDIGVCEGASVKVHGGASDNDLGGGRRSVAGIIQRNNVQLTQKFQHYRNAFQVFDALPEPASSVGTSNLASSGLTPSEFSEAITIPAGRQDYLLMAHTVHQLGTLGTIMFYFWWDLELGPRHL